MTLRDVFRWAKRLSTDETCDDYCQVLANHGYMLLAGRCRNREDELTVISTLEALLKTKIKVRGDSFLYTLRKSTKIRNGNIGGRNRGLVG